MPAGTSHQYIEWKPFTYSKYHVLTAHLLYWLTDYSSHEQSVKSLGGKQYENLVEYNEIYRSLNFDRTYNYKWCNKYAGTRWK